MAGNGGLASAITAFLAVLLWLGSTTAEVGARASHRHPRHFHLNHRHRQLRSSNNNLISGPSPAPSYVGPVYPPAYDAAPPYYAAWAPHYPPSYAPPYYSTPAPYPPTYPPTYQPPPPPPPPPPSPPPPSPPPPPPSPQPPSPLSVLCAAPTSCPDTATLAAAGIPNAACGDCSVSEQCFVESRQDQFLGAGAASSFLSVASCANAKTDGSVTDPVLSFLTFPRYPTLPVADPRYPYLHLYLAAADTAPGDSVAVAVACYTDASLTEVDKYLVLQRIHTATLAAAGIPNAACGNCSVSEQCFVESRQDQFLGAGAASSFLSVASCANAKTDGSVTDPVLSFLTFPRYPTLPVVSPRYPYLHLYLAAADTAPGDSVAVAVACYTDASLTEVDKYLVLQRIPTAADNYRCPSCKWFWSFEVRTPAAPSC
ncbi:hypothetical protein CHLRE_09g392251v5 [Chlamydomonas reinhardtii]|uniref:Pherophorin domain-containing protein n=1 Tax=Chlamydomonas reinhardtii TaxID=3055 RepID=A0A2K3DDF3_CHLRE|nr:uncharacterized protein CHLRE_09g392251v5 [Chlamydomonas reinhardtii]PNW78561.1 hypothetical protein CHLRE_09g392251v5 [Chlamydomonas reinhardtii]